MQRLVLALLFAGVAFGAADAQTVARGPFDTQAGVAGAIPDGTPARPLSTSEANSAAIYAAVSSGVGNSPANPLYAAVQSGSGPITASNPLPTTNPEAPSTSFSVTAAGTVQAALDVSLQGYQMAVITVTSAGTGNTLTGQGSNDGTTWINLTCSRADGFQVTTWGYAGQFFCPTAFRYYQLSVTAYGSGTIAGTLYFRRQPNFLLSGLTYLQPSATGGLSGYAVNSGASTNATLIASGSHNVMSYDLCNGGTVAGYLRFFDNGSAPVPGTTTPKTGALLIPAGACRTASLTDFGLYFNNGLGLDITAAQAANDATALTGSTVISGYVAYK